MRSLILLVEDNEQILYGNERMLRRRNYDVITALTLSEARKRMDETTPDAIVLDIMMPDGSGLDFMRELREKSAIPILLLTGLATSEDIVHGLAEGGDDYLTKPYDFSVLLARIEALLRRAKKIPDILQKDSLKLDIVAQQAFLDGEDMLLRPKEFALLLMFIQNEGKVLDPQYLYQKVWNTDMNADNSTLKMHISTVRKRLEEKNYGYKITNIRGEGYRFEKEV
jgi:DNA-binding response OmpR family regulator